MFLPIKCVVDEVSPGHHASSAFTNDNLTRYATFLHKPRDEDVFPKNIVPGHLCSDNAPNNTASVYAYFDVQVSKQRVLETTALLLNYFCHLKSHLDETICLVDGVLDRTLFSRYFALIAHNNVDVS